MLWKWHPNAKEQPNKTKESRIGILKEHLLAYFKGWKLRKIMQNDFVTNAKRSLAELEQHITKLGHE
jgi:hypothetical protein